MLENSKHLLLIISWESINVYVTYAIPAFFQKHSCGWNVLCESLLKTCVMCQRHLRIAYPTRKSITESTSIWDAYRKTCRDHPGCARNWSLYKLAFVQTQQSQNIYMIFLICHINVMEKTFSIDVRTTLSECCPKISDVLKMFSWCLSQCQSMML